MLQLGINPCIEGINYHDPSVALVSEGGTLFAAEEERFNRVKGSPGQFPLRALQHVVNNYVGDRPYELAIPFCPAERRRRTAMELRSELRHTGLHDVLNDPGASDKFRDLRPTLLHSARSLMEYIDVHQFWTRPTSINAALLHYFEGLTKPNAIHFVEHHLAHAAGSYLQSPFESAVAVVVDGVGEFSSSSIWHCTPENITCIERTDFPNSIGYFYAAITAFLGFTPWRDEGKTMALAPYGRVATVAHERLIQTFCTKERVDFSSLVQMCTGRGLSLNVGLARQAISDLLQLPPRHPECPIDDVHRDVAAAAQDIVETALMEIVRRGTVISGLRNVCASGGVFYNCKANGVIRRRAAIEGLFVQPVCGDAGTSHGAALYRVWHETRARPTPPVSLALGRQLVPEEVRHQLRDWRIAIAEDRMVPTDIATRIASGELVMWVQGASEFGPRALGNRSILADPRNVDTAARVNRTIKHRELWRPFGPSIAMEFGDAILEGIDERTPPYFMIEAYNIRELWRERIPAVLHPADSSARPQLVSSTSNPRLHSLLLAFYEITGVPVLMNTSLNGCGEPLVDSVQDAIRLFQSSGATVLVIDDVVILKS
jgi:carbamoyltransferase